MGNTRYQLASQQSEPIKAKLLYVSSSKYEGDWLSIQHVHYFSELFYVRSGQGKFIVEGKTFSVSQDDIVIVNPNVEHTELSVNNDPLEYVVLGVEGMHFDFESMKTDDDEDSPPNYSVIDCSEQREELLFYFTTMLRETKDKSEHYDLFCQDLLELLIITLIRNADYSFSVVSSQKASKECSKIKSYIEFYFSTNITLDSLAKMAHLNKYYLVHAFTKYYGLSPISYLNEKRIQCTKELLESTDYSISQIAQTSGFSSQSYFSQSFRKACAMTPAEYRKTARLKSE